MQYVIRWNPSVLKYLTIDNFGAVPQLDIADFNATHAIDSGFLRLVWEGPNSFPGVSVPDGTTIYRIRFNVIGADTSSSSVRFTEIVDGFPQTEFEIVKVVNPDSTLQAYDEHACDLVNGFVAVGFTVATEEPDGAELDMAVAPNPFSESAHVEFSLTQQSDIQLVVTDVVGRIVYQKNISSLPQGKHGIDIDKANFPAKGAYFLTVHAGTQVCVRPILFN